ncbi:transcription factor IIIA, partial [Xylariaceae sp. FL1019]
MKRASVLDPEPSGPLKRVRRGNAALLTHEPLPEHHHTGYEDDNNYGYDYHSDPESEPDTQATTSLAANTPDSATPDDAPSPQPYPYKKFLCDVKTIRCDFPGCEKTFNRPARLETHRRTHYGDRTFKCTYDGCDKDYTSKKNLDEHIKGAHKDERTYTCTHLGCGKSFMTATRLKRHRAVHEGRFQCTDYPPCTDKFRKAITLERHIRAVHQNRPAYTCTHVDPDTGALCTEGFKSVNSLKRHEQRVHGENLFFCEECAENETDEHGNSKIVGFPTITLLQNHVKEAHIRCLFCNRVFNSRPEMEDHVETVHVNPPHQPPIEERKIVACTWPGCTKTFTRISNRNTHIRSAHERGAVFICGDFDLSEYPDLVTWPQSDGCGKSFNNKYNLEKHVRHIHLKVPRPEVPYPTGKLYEPTTLELLTGMRDNLRQTIPCTFPGCHLKFQHLGQRAEHIRQEHGAEEALIGDPGELHDEGDGDGDGDR